MRNESPSEYLQHHIEEENIDAVEAARESLGVPIGEVQYSESGDVRVENPPFVLEFSYEFLPDNADSITVSNGQKIEAKNFAKISSLQLFRSDNGAVIALSEIVPIDYSVLFCPSRTDDDWNSVCNMTQKQIVVGGDITKPEYIIHLLHEAGHAQIYENNSTDQNFSAEKNSTRRTVDLSSEAKKLLAERDADAFALRKFRPFLNSKEGTFQVSKDDVLVLSHNFALRSFTEALAREVAEKRSMHHFAMDYVDSTDYAEYLPNWDEIENDDPLKN